MPSRTHKYTNTLKVTGNALSVCQVAGSTRSRGVEERWFRKSEGPSNFCDDFMFTVMIQDIRALSSVELIGLLGTNVNRLRRHGGKYDL